MQFFGLVRNAEGMKKFLKNNWIYLIGAVIILTLFSLRFVNLAILPVFADEAIYIRWAQVMKAEETLRFLPLSDGKQPLFMWIAIPFLKFIENPLIAGRLVSVFSGFGTMIGVSFLSYLLFRSKKVALAAGSIYAVSPFFFFFDRMSLVDSLLAMFGVWTFIFAYLAFTRKRLDFAMIAGFSLGGAWLTKSSALFFVLMLPTLWLFVGWQKGFKKNIPVFLKTLFLTVVMFVIGYGFYNVLRLGPNFHLIASRNLDYVYPINHFLVRPLDPLKTFLLASWQWLMTLGTGFLILLGFSGYFVNWRRNWKTLLVLTIWFLGPIIVQSEFAKVFTARYILFTIPFLIIIASSAFLDGRRNVLKILAVILAFFISQSLIFDYRLLVSPAKANLPRSERSGYLEEWTAGQGIAETADYLIKERVASPKDKIVIGTEGYFGTLPDGLQFYLNRYPEITAIGVGLNFDRLPSQLINSKKAGNKTYLLVNASRFHNSAEALGLKLIKDFPKAQKPDGTHDSLLFFEVTNEALKNKANSTDS